MSRYGTKRKFEEIEFKKLGIKVVVYIRTSGEYKGAYVAVVGDDTVEGATYAEIVPKIKALVESNSALTWFPIIEVGIEKGGSYGSRGAVKTSLVLEQNRYYVAQRKDGGWRQVSWEVPEDERTAKSSEMSAVDYEPGAAMSSAKAVDFNALPAAKRGYQGFAHREDEPVEYTYYLPYNEATWLGIEWVSEQLNKLRERLDQMLGSDEGRAIITAKAVKLLGGQ